jgi:hypothetical protein
MVSNEKFWTFLLINFLYFFFDLCSILSRIFKFKNPSFWSDALHGKIWVQILTILVFSVLFDSSSPCLHKITPRKASKIDNSVQISQCKSHTSSATQLLISLLINVDMYSSFGYIIVLFFLYCRCSFLH